MKLENFIPSLNANPFTLDHRFLAVWVSQMNHAKSHNSTQSLCLTQESEYLCLTSATRRQDKTWST